MSKSRWFFLLVLLLSVPSTLSSSLQAQESSTRSDTSAQHRGRLRLSPEQLVFPPTAVGDSAAAFLSARNDSLRPTIITQVLGGGSSFRLDPPAPVEIPAGTTVELRVIYVPDHFGRTSETLRLVSDAGEALVALRGRSPFPVLIPGEQAFDFDSVARGTMSERTLSIRNSSINVLEIDSVWTHTPVFHPLTARAAIRGSDTAVVAVAFAPVFSGSFSDTLFIGSNARGRVTAIPLSGISPPPMLAVSLEEVRFGETSITDSLVGWIQLVDASISSLNLQSFRTNGLGFSVRGGSVPSVIPGNDTVIVPVVFRPGEFGEFVDTVSIESDGGLARVPLRGKSPYPILMASSDTLAFDDVRKGTAARHTFFIKNPSINVLRVDSVFTRTRWFTARLRKPVVRSTDSVAVDVTFAPDRFRAFSDTVVIVGNSLNRRVEISLSGVSPPPIPAVALRSLELEPVSMGDTCFGEFVVYNQSRVNDLTIGGIRKKLPFFSMASRLPAVLGRRDSVTLRVRFTVNENAAGGYGIHNDTLQIESDGGSMRVAVTGISPFPSVAAGTDELDFGSVQKGARATVPLWISNPSLNTVRLDSIGFVYGRAFSQTGMEFPGNIKRGRAHSFTIAFAPDTDAVYSDTLRVYSSAPGPPLKILLKGRCFSPRAAEATGVGIPTEFCLFKNYPNPFNGTTTIKFGLPHPGSVSLAVFNTLGQLVAELVNGYLEAGYHTAVFNSAGLSSGLYFYRLQAGEFVDTKKLVVLR